MLTYLQGTPRIISQGRAIVPLEGMVLWTALQQVPLWALDPLCTRWILIRSLRKIRP